MNWEFELLYFFQSLHKPWLDPVMTGASRLADHGMIWILTAVVLLCFQRTRRIGIAVSAALILSFLTGNLFLKNVVMRSRPCWIDPDIPLLISSPKDFSFPSGHTMASFAAAVSIYLQDKRWGLAAVCLAALIACSRLYLFVHFPTDVLFGLVWGAGLAILVNRVMRRYPE